MGQQIDDKSARMFAMFAERRFEGYRTNQRLRLRIIIWSIRTKIVRSLKRAFDLIVASLAILLTAPLMVLTALLIKLDSPGPILFRQVRVGKDGEHFSCYKFRSTHSDAEQHKAELPVPDKSDGPRFKSPNDTHVTRVGRVIRKLNIDELPQLFNVIKGEMSLVGPRPALPSEVAAYTYDQLGRIHATPGITGLQQVSGRGTMDFKRWVELDLQYISEQSLWKDIEILMKTIPAVIFGKGTS